MKKKQINIIQNEMIPAALTLHKEEDELTQYLYFTKPVKKRGTKPEEIEIPLDKAMRASVTIKKVPSSSGRHLEQVVRVYRKTKKKASETILSTRYSRVSVSRTRVTFSMSFALCDDPQRLTARLQNFANIIIDESDEIAAMLNQEGTAKVQEAWKSLSTIEETKTN